MGASKFESLARIPPDIYVFPRSNDCKEGNLQDKIVYSPVSLMLVRERSMFFREGYVRFRMYLIDSDVKSELKPIKSMVSSL